mmetsp:Transcript_43404/g.122874  ORF Transcript_43404/g.122874 Transcript_43404/m.122874 type:complete len:358 (-) Transcript_43404:1252-2325(-)
MRRLMQRLRHWQRHHSLDGRELVLLLPSHLREAHAEVELQQGLLRAHQLGSVDDGRFLRAEVVGDEGVELRRERLELCHGLGLGGRVVRQGLALVQHSLDLHQHGIALLDLRFRKLAKRLIVSTAGLSTAFVFGAGLFFRQSLVLHIDPHELARLHHELFGGTAEAVAGFVQVLLAEVDDGPLHAAIELLDLRASLAHTDAAPLPEDPVLSVAGVVGLQNVHRVVGVGARCNVGSRQHLAVDPLFALVHEHVHRRSQLTDIGVHSDAHLLDELRRLPLRDLLPPRRLAPQEERRQIKELAGLNAARDEVLAHATDVQLLGLFDHLVVFLVLVLVVLLLHHSAVGDDAEGSLGEGVRN